MATVQEKIDQLHEKLAKIEMGGGQKRIDSQHRKGKMTAANGWLSYLMKAASRKWGSSSIIAA